MDNLIITIGREFGSNGRLVGEKTAENREHYSYPGMFCYGIE